MRHVWDEKCLSVCDRYLDACKGAGIEDNAIVHRSVTAIIAFKKRDQPFNTLMSSVRQLAASSDSMRSFVTGETTTEVPSESTTA